MRESLTALPHTEVTGLTIFTLIIVAFMVSSARALEIALALIPTAPFQDTALMIERTDWDGHIERRLP